jgi:hypothetical protein
VSAGTSDEEVFLIDASGENRALSVHLRTSESLVRSN